MKYICVQPRLVYYSWQLEVMLNNFYKHGINKNDIHVLIAYSPNGKDKTNDEDVKYLFSKLENKFDIKFYNYEDTRLNPYYIPSVRPNILKQHFLKFPNLENEIFFYHDCDMIFTSKPDFSVFESDKIWYMSDTISYIGSNYIRSKGIDIYNNMCDIIGIDNQIPMMNELNSGGAQYILKGLNFNFWQKVEQDSEKLYSFFTDDEKIKVKNNPNYHPIQKWTSDMWSLLWNAWFFGFETKVDKYLNFTWATDPISKWNDNVIYHNAGAIVSNSELFYKGNFINSLPYFIENTFSKEYSSYNYFLEILETKEKSCLTSW